MNDYNDARACLNNDGWDYFDEGKNEVELFLDSGLDRIRKDCGKYAKANTDRLRSFVRRYQLEDEVAVSKHGSFVELRRIND